jgi:hypothetical protein
MSKRVAPDEDSNPCQNAIEQIERTDSAEAYEIEQRTLHAQICKGLMQALEDSICACFLLV